VDLIFYHVEIINRNWKALVGTEYRLPGSSFSGTTKVSSFHQYFDTGSEALLKSYFTGTWTLSWTL